MEPAAILRILLEAQGVKETQLQLARVNAEAKRTADSTDKLEKSFSRANNRTAEFNRSMQGLRNTISIIKWPALIAGAGGAAQAVGALGAASVGIVGSFAALAQGAVVSRLGLGQLVAALGGSKKAIDSLTPSQHALYASIIKLKDTWKGAAQNEIPGFTKAVQVLQPLFTSLKPIIAATAKELGSLATAAAQMLASMGPQFTRIGNTNVQVLHNLGMAAINLVKGFINIIDAARPLTLWLSQTFSRLAKQFADWTGSMAGKNALAQFFQQSQEPIHQVFLLVGAIGKQLFNILRPTPQTAGMIKQLRQLVNVIGGVVATTARTLGPQLIGTLTHLGQIFGAIAGTSGPLNAVFKVLDKITGVIANVVKHNPQLGTLTSFILGLGTSWKVLTLLASPLAKVGGEVAKMIELGSRARELGGLTGAFKGLLGLFTRNSTGLIIGAGVALAGLVVGLANKLFHLGDAQKQVSVTARQVANAWRAERSAADALKGADLGIAQGKLNLQQALIAERQAQNQATDALHKYGKNSSQYRQAQLNARQATLDAKQAQQDLTNAVNQGDTALQKRIKTTGKSIQVDTARLLQDKGQLDAAIRQKESLQDIAYWTARVADDQRRAAGDQKNLVGLDKDRVSALKAQLGGLKAAGASSGQLHDKEKQLSAAEAQLKKDTANLADALKNNLGNGLSNAGGAVAKLARQGLLHLQSFDQGGSKAVNHLHDSVNNDAASMYKTTGNHVARLVTEGVAHFADFFKGGSKNMDNLTGHTESKSQKMRDVISSQTGQAAAHGITNFTHLQTAGSHQLDLTKDHVSGSTGQILNLIGTRTGQAAAQSTTHFNSLHDHATTAMNQTHDNVKNNTGTMLFLIGSRTAASARSAGVNFQKYKNNVGHGAQEALNAVNSGTSQILHAVSTGLGALGSAIKINIKLNGHIPGFERGGEVTKAAKGLYQFGEQGRGGRDNIPVNFGGNSIMVGSGEMGAVFTRHQKQLADQMMAPIGGLTGLFKNATKPHYMATGGYVFPWPAGTRTERVDQGWDAAMPVGSPIGAIGKARIGPMFATPWLGQPFMSWELLEGPAKGRWVYLAEQIRPRVRTGQVVNANTAVATFAPSGTGIEMGWTSASAAQTAHSLAAEQGDVSPGSHYSPEGTSFKNFLLGLAHGKINLSGGVGSFVPTIKAPKVTGGGKLGQMAQAALNKVTAQANKYILAHEPAFGSAPGNLGSIPPGSGPVEKQMYDAGTKLGLTKIAIAGMIGNAFQESSLNPNLNVPGGRGLFSWNPGGNPDASKVILGNVPEQMALAVSAINKAAFDATSSPAAAATWFEQNFEHADPSKANMPNRIAAAQRAYSQGYAQGGFLPPYGGSFAQGGIVPGSRGEPRTIIAHGGETVSSNNTGGPLVNIENMNMLDATDASTFAHKLAWLVET